MSHTISEVTFNALGGSCSIDLPEIQDSDSIIQTAVAEVRRIEKKYSRYLEAGIVSQINSNAGKEWVSCDEETCSLFDYAEHLHSVSGGLFDITSGILRRAWDFQNASVPSREQIDELRPMVNWRDFERQGNAVRLKKIGMQIDLGGYGKEYAVDRVAAILSEYKVSNALINFGGDMRALGTRPNGKAWSIGIQDPRKLDSCFASIELESGALATSGDYERYFEVEGNRYCHVLNPRTGMPVSYWRSITVLAPLAIAAGSTTTIAMLLEERGLKYLEDSGFGFLAINNQGKIFKSM